MNGPRSTTKPFQVRNLDKPWWPQDHKIEYDADIAKQFRDHFLGSDDSKKILERWKLRKQR